MGMTFAETLIGELSAAALELSGNPCVRVSYSDSLDRNTNYVAVVDCKPRNHRFRIIRGYGSSIEGALNNLQHELMSFKRGRRDGEQ